MKKEQMEHEQNNEIEFTPLTNDAIKKQADDEAVRDLFFSDDVNHETELEVLEGQVFVDMDEK